MHSIYAYVRDGLLATGEWRSKVPWSLKTDGKAGEVINHLRPQAPFIIPPSNPRPSTYTPIVTFPGPVPINYPVQLNRGLQEISAPQDVPPSWLGAVLGGDF